MIFSAAVVALLFWLSVSFLVVAFQEKQDTEFLKHYVVTDKVLRNASIVIAEERSASYWLSGFESLDNSVQSLTRPQTATDEAVAEVHAQYQSIAALPNYGNQLRFRWSRIQSLFTDLKSNIARLDAQRDYLRSNLNLSLSEREIDLEKNILDYYRSIVEQLQSLRFAASYVSTGQLRATQNLFAISDAVWNIRLSNHLLTALFEGYLTSGSMARGEALIMANSHLNKIKENIATLRSIDSYANVDPNLNTAASRLDSWYQEFYYMPMHDISIAMAENKPAPHSNYEWKKISRGMAEHSENLLTSIDEITEQRLNKAGHKATRNLVIDSFLIVLCVALVFFAYWIVRRVHHQATHDVLTGLPNRRSFVTSCQQRVNPDNNSKTTLIKADVSKFKEINDSFGHYVGDKLLQEVAGKIKNGINGSHSVSRLGSDEFAVLLENTDCDSGERTARELAESLSGHYKIEGQSLDLKATVGFACFPDDADSSENLVKAADLALHESKQKGPGTVTRYNPAIADAFHERQRMESDLGLALERGEFELHYQPQFDVESQMVDGVEALIRWRHPSRGLVSPFHFIPVAEDAGLLPAIGEWVIKEAIRQSVVWKKENDLHLRVSVNVSAHQFIEGDVVGIIQNALIKAELEPQSFEIEITESVAMFDVSTVVKKLKKLHNTGIRIALDDFGTGYSSLSYLRDLPLDTLKIDRSFVTELDDGSHRHKMLIESIAAMAKQLELHTVAEGVETNSQLKQVCALGIDTVQGYYYSKPVEAKDLPRDVKAIDAAYAIDKAA